MNKKSMNFQYGDRELILKVADLISENVDVIVNSANNSLIHDEGLAEKISVAAGNELQQQSKRLIAEYGTIESGMAVYTDSFDLGFKAIIHAVGPNMGEGEEQHKIEQSVSRSMLLCETNDWKSIAFPALSTGRANVPVELCAQAFFRSIISFWDARNECSVEKIVICLSEDHFPVFFNAFREDAISQNNNVSKEPPIENEQEEVTGYITISADEQENLDDDELSDWFK
jgi:O-acetyl-ADP-ribose deacetylase (regulator of RNase III)